MPIQVDDHLYDEVWNARGEYRWLLRKVFDQGTPKDLAELPADTGLGRFVQDYIMLCNPDIREAYETAKRSLLEQRAQRPPKLTKSVNDQTIDQWPFDDSGPTLTG